METKRTPRKNTARKQSHPTKKRSQVKSGIVSASFHTEAMLIEAQRIFHIGSWNWNLTTGKIYFSEEMFRIVGMFPNEAEITRETFKKFLHPNEAEEILQTFQHSASQPFSSIEHKIVLPSGEIRIAHTRIKAYKDEHGNPMLLLGSTQDITERKHTEEALKIAEADYRAIFEGAPIGIFRSTVEGGFIKVNQAMARMYGYSSPAEMTASVTSIATQIYSESNLRSALSILLAEKGEVLGFESLDQRKDGSAFWTSLNARAVKNDNGQIMYYEGFVTDISAQKNYESALHRKNQQLHDQINEIKKLQDILREQAIRDQLTGLYNRRYLLEAITQEHSRALREGYPISIIMLDLDHLKEINKTYGHFNGGDAALRALAEYLKSMIRTEDIVCRYGGDEFIIVLHNAAAQVAQERAEQWRQSVIKIDLYSKGKKFHITFSAGIAAFPINGENMDEVMQAADKALYHAKESGRNCVMVYPE